MSAMAPTQKLEREQNIQTVIAEDRGYGTLDKIQPLRQQEKIAWLLSES